MSELFDEEPGDVLPDRRASGRSRALVITAVVLVLAFFGLTTFASFYTDRLWYRDGGYGSVFSHAAVDPGRAVRGLRRADGPGGRRQHGGGVPAAAAVPPAVAGAGRAGPLPPGGHPDPDLAGGWASRCCWASSPAPRPRGSGASTCCGATACRSTASTPTSSKDIGFYVFDLPWYHYLVDFVMAASVVVAARGGGRALPVRRHPAAVAGRPALRRGPGAALGAAGRLRARQGRRLLAGPLRPGAPVRLAADRDHLHRRERGAAREEHPDGHRADLCGAVLPQRLAPHLAAAVDGPGAAGAVGDPAGPDLAGDRPGPPGPPVRAGQGGASTSRRTSRPPGRRTTSTRSRPTRSSTPRPPRDRGDRATRRSSTPPRSGPR